MALPAPLLLPCLKCRGAKVKPVQRHVASEVQRRRLRGVRGGASRSLWGVGQGSGGGVARRARVARAPKAKSCAMSFTCPSFTCRPRAAWGVACVCWAWVTPLKDNACHDKHLHAPLGSPPPPDPSPSLLVVLEVLVLVATGARRLVVVLAVLEVLVQQLEEVHQPPVTIGPGSRRPRVTGPEHA